MKQNYKDKAEELIFATTKGAIGVGGAALAVADPKLAALGFLAPFLVEWFGVTLPSKRLDRLEKMLIYFAAKTTNIDPNFIEEKMKEDEYQNLFEHGCQYATEAIETKIPIRLEAIANVLASECRNQSTPLRADKCLSVIKSLNNFDLYLLIELEKILSEGFKDGNTRPRMMNSTIYQQNWPDHKDLVHLTHRWFSGENSNEIVGFDEDIAKQSMQLLSTMGITFAAGNKNDQESQRWYLTGFGDVLVGYVRGKPVE